MSVRRFRASVNGSRCAWTVATTSVASSVVTASRNAVDANSIRRSSSPPVMYVYVASGGGVEGAAGLVQGVAELVRGGFGGEVRPQEVDDLFAVEAVAGGEGQEFDERRRFAEPPARLGHLVATDRDPEAAEQRPSGLKAGTRRGSSRLRSAVAAVLSESSGGVASGRRTSGDLGVVPGGGCLLAGDIVTLGEHIS